MEEICKHENKHFVSAVSEKGKPLNKEAMTCDLPKGHEGDHHAIYITLVQHEEVEAEAFWSNAVDS